MKCRSQRFSLKIFHGTGQLPLYTEILYSALAKRKGQNFVDLQSYKNKAIEYTMKQFINVKGKLMDLGQPKIMGILNTTPDSFYAGSRARVLSEIRQRVEEMIENGVDIIDIGGYSTRPGASDVSVNQELDRVLPAIEHISVTYPQIPISIDTFRATVAKEAVCAGAAIVNDVSGGNLDENMFETVAVLQVPYVLMHMRGTPATMSLLNQYEDLILEVIGELEVKINRLKTLGVKDIIVDPGFGFSKNSDQNYQLLKHFEKFQVLNLPVLAGLSRKSMIWKKLDILPEEALNGTTALNTVALMKKATILRVHDVKEAIEARNLLIQNIL